MGNTLDLSAPGLASAVGVEGAEFANRLIGVDILAVVGVEGGFDRNGVEHSVSISCRIHQTTLLLTVF
jgi:hypothetical protein